MPKTPKIPKKRNHNISVLGFSGEASIHDMVKKFANQKGISTSKLLRLVFSTYMLDNAQQFMNLYIKSERLSAEEEQKALVNDLRALADQLEKDAI
jgi:hypothetical protein